MAPVPSRIAAVAALVCGMGGGTLSQGILDLPTIHMSSKDGIWS